LEERAEADAVAANGAKPRAGIRVLSLLANPLHAHILRGHLEGPQRLTKLHEKIGWSAHTTLRTSVDTLCEAGVLAREPHTTNHSTENRLTPAGEETLFVADALEAWLARAPCAPIAPDSAAARSAVKALAGGWSSTLIRALAARPYSLTELNALIPEVNYPGLERRLTKMRVSRQIEPVRGEGRSTPYAVTDWLRRAIAPLAAAGRCERRHMREATAPITEVEVEAAFLLATPLAPLPASANGTCMLAVHTESGDRAGAPPPHLAGVTVEVRRGEVVACAARVDPAPATWALGAPNTWLDFVIDGDPEALRIGGAKPQLAADLVNGIHHALFGEMD
jgi:DNA-binding HxlR family transcriptional regulator